MAGAVRGVWARVWRVLAALLALAGLGVAAVLTMPPLGRWLVAWYQDLAEAGPVDFGLPVVLALLAVALVIGLRTRAD